MKIICFLCICFCISSVDCINCSNVIIDGQFYGLSIYNRFEPYFATDSLTYIQENYMDNKQGHYWKFEVSVNDNLEPTLNMTGNALPLDVEVEKRFGIIYEPDEANKVILVNCHLMKESNSSDLGCNYKVYVLRIRHANRDAENKFNFTRNSVILQPFPSLVGIPSEVHYPNNSYVMAINRDNKAKRIRIFLTSDYKIRTEICDQQCPKIPFIDQMDDQLFRGFDSAVQYLKDSLSGHLLLFNINDRPFYCFQPKGQPLSQQV